jgi:hypothetical protein
MSNIKYHIELPYHIGIEKNQERSTISCAYVRSMMPVYSGTVRRKNRIPKPGPKGIYPYGDESEGGETSGGRNPRYRLRVEETSVIVGTARSWKSGDE